MTGPGLSRNEDLDRVIRKWRIRVFIAAWTMYASYYLCRLNFSIAVPALKKFLGGGMVTEESEKMVGAIGSALFLAYALGQVVNGLLGDRFGPRKVGTIGMVVSATMNLLFGLVGSFPAFVAIWAVNGFFQATGAPSRIKVLSNWFSPKERGKMMGFLGTDYVVGNAVSWLLAGWLLQHYGWRYVFIVPAFIFFASAIHFFLRVRNAPEDVGLPTIEELEGKKKSPASGEEGEKGDVHAGWDFVFRQTFLNLKVWIVAIAYFGVDLFRYGFLMWSFDYVVSQGAPVGRGVIKVVMVPFFGALGIIVSGWLSDRLGGRRAPVTAVMLFIVAALAWVFRLLPAGEGNFWLPLITLAGIGFFLFGPHLMMGATIAMDLGSRKASATASGIIDAMGYLGAAVSGYGTAWVKQRWGWDGAFILWISGAVVAGILMLFLWNYRVEEDREYL